MSLPGPPPTHPFSLDSQCPTSSRRAFQHAASIPPAASRSGLIRSGILGVKRFIEIFLRSFSSSKIDVVSMVYGHHTGGGRDELSKESVDKEVDNSRHQQTSLIRPRICAADTIV
jgi:hypothetical protein